MTTENEQPKSAEEIRPINIKILVAENISKGLAEFIKDDEIQEFYEELIVDTVLHFLSLRESSAQQRIKELEASNDNLIKIADTIQQAAAKVNKLYFEGQQRIKERERMHVQLATDYKNQEEYNDILRKRIKELYEALEITWKSLQTYGDHPIINLHVESVLKKR